MTVTVVRYRTKPERAEENQRLVEQVYAALAESRPEGFRYMTVRLADGVSFVHIASVETADGTNPLTSTPAFGAFQAEIGARLEEGPVVAEGTVIGSYEFPVDAVRAGDRP
jgi:hypothetical protein